MRQCTYIDIGIFLLTNVGIGIRPKIPCWCAAVCFVFNQDLNLNLKH